MSWELALKLLCWEPLGSHHRVPAVWGQYRKAQPSEASIGDGGGRKFRAIGIDAACRVHTPL